MMRLPGFRYTAPRTLAEAASILEGEGEAAMILAGGTDLLPNMKRRQQTPTVLVALRRVESLRQVAASGELALGASLTLTDLAREERVRRLSPALWQAVVQIATPHLRNMGTLGGNLCLDTRCNYYDQGEEWRRSIDFCMKKDGAVCWVAPSSRRCLAISSTDSAPALVALGARVRLVSAAGERIVPLSDLYADDGIHYLTRRPDEILSEVRVPLPAGWRSTYWKLRRRGAFDFPVLSVAAAARLRPDGGVEEARLVVGAVASRPLLLPEAAARLLGRPLTDDAIEEAATEAARVARPMDNTDFTLHWRKRALAVFVGFALREIRGDDVRVERERYARRPLEQMA